MLMLMEGALSSGEPYFHDFGFKDEDPGSRLQC